MSLLCTRIDHNVTLAAISEIWKECTTNTISITNATQYKNPAPDYTAHCFLDTYFVINISTTPKLSKFFYTNILFCIVLHCDENGKNNNRAFIFSVFSLGCEGRKSNSTEQTVYAEHTNMCVRVCIYVCMHIYTHRSVYKILVLLTSAVSQPQMVLLSANYNYQLLHYY